MENSIEIFFCFRALDERDVSEKWFPLLLRVNQVLIESDQILSAAVMQNALKIDQAVKAITVTEGGETYEFDDLCYKAGANCLQNNLLEVWGYSASNINALTDSGVKNKVNEDPLLRLDSSNFSPVVHLGFQKTKYNGEVAKTMELLENIKILNKYKLQINRHYQKVQGTYSLN